MLLLAFNEQRATGFEAATYSLGSNAENKQFGPFLLQFPAF